MPVAVRTRKLWENLRRSLFSLCDRQLLASEFWRGVAGEGRGEEGAEAVPRGIRAQWRDPESLTDP